MLASLQNELHQFVSSNNELLNNLDKLIYLDAVIKEALRITPVIPNLVRVTNGDYQLGEYTLSKGTIIAPCIYLTHRDPDYWAEPQRFMPERFLDSTEKPFTYFPFGFGIRRCIGAAFAQYEMKIIIAQILLSVDLELEANYTTKPERRGPVFSPGKNLPVKIIRQSNIP